MRTEYKIRRDFTYRRKKQKRKKLIIRGAVILLVVLVLIIIALLAGSRKGSSEETEVSQNTEVTTQPVTELLLGQDLNLTEENTETAQPSSSYVEEVAEAPENSPEFEEIIARAGYSSDELEFDQLITVDAYGVTAVVNAFEKVDGAWVKADVLLAASGFVGTQGVSADASEYASYTPKGLYALGTGFGICDDPGTALDYFKVTEDSYWVDDVNSVYYNQHVEGTENKDWTSAEHLIEYNGAYDYCVFIEYNTDPIVPGDGSAFFLHVGESATAGCVAVSRNDMIETLCWLDKTQDPHILIF